MINLKQFEILRLLCGKDYKEHKSINQIYAESSGAINSDFESFEKNVNFLSNLGFINNNRISDLGKNELEQYRVNNAFIFAAGSANKGPKEIYSLPKGLYKVKGEILIERQIEQLLNAGIKNIYVVVGYKKHMFLYLQEKYKVEFVVNINPTKNNIFSMHSVLDKLGNSYICNCDMYYPKNPFNKYEYRSFHSTVVKNDTTNEIAVQKNMSDRITGLFLKKDGGECLYGHAYLDYSFSNTFKEFLEKEINDFRNDNLFWQEYYIKHVADLDLYTSLYSDNEIWEFDSIQELQFIDNLFIENVSQKALEKICSVLKCEISDIKELKILSKGLSNILFTFRVYDVDYIFRFPGGSTSNILTNREKEVVAQKIAYEAGIDNTYVYIDKTGCKLSKYVKDIKDLKNIYYHDLDFMIELTKKIRKFHDCGDSIQNLTTYSYDPMKEADRLLEMACETMGDLFERFRDFRLKIKKIYEKCEQNKIKKTICHNDINSDNCILTDKSFDLIDFEFAGYNDPAFDFGRVIANYDYNSDEIDKLLEAYFGRKATEIERVHWISYVAIHSWYYFVWCLYKESINEDTREWMLYFYDTINKVLNYLKTHKF